MLQKKGRDILFVSCMVIGIILVTACATMEAPVQPWGKIIEVARISPQDAHQEVASGVALLVCAYGDEELCRRILLHGAISLKTFESMVPDLKKDTPIIFYCG